MNNQERDILQIVTEQTFTSQRLLSKLSGHSLGIVNRSLKSLIEQGYLTEDKCLTPKAKQEIAAQKTERAIILAAGYGMRMVPINTEMPKGLLEIGGEALIERLIRQLHEAGITEIHIVVGFLKERYEYLIDKYNVNLIVNADYSRKNNLFSLYKALPYIENAYIIPCDLWCRTNPFRVHELYSWYMISDAADRDSKVRINRNRELMMTVKGEEGHRMIGICYLTKEDGRLVRERLEQMVQNPAYDDAFWEEALLQNNKILPAARVVSDTEVYEINTFEQLRELDDNSSHLQSEAMEIIAEVFHVLLKDIINITVLKKGMTNRSFLFECQNKKYIMRIPGEGTDRLINRRQEAVVYDVIGNKNLSDSIVYINPDNGYKITEYMENTRVCEASDWKDVEKCMQKLREFHQMKLRAAHEFNLFEQMEFYEGLWGETPSMYRDYSDTKQKVYELKQYIDAQPKEYILSHIDSVPDNFLFAEDGSVRLIDWEYAAMQDPHVDLAMFSVYSFYNKEQIDKLMDIYFEGNAETDVRIKIYCYIAVCGLLWSNWSEYKQQLGIELGEYSLRQYRYAKDFYRIAKEEMQKL